MTGEGRGNNINRENIKELIFRGRTQTNEGSFSFSIFNPNYF